MSGENRTPFKRFLDAREAQRKDPDDASRLHKREMQSAIFNALKRYSKTGDPKDLPTEMSAWIALEMEAVADGQTSDFLSPVRERGRPQLHPRVVDAIKDLRRYVEAARSGLIDDKAFIKTVLHHFGGSRAGGLSVDTIKAWLKDDRYKVEPSINDDDPNMITTLMEKSGEFYRHFALKATKWHGQAY